MFSGITCWHLLGGHWPCSEVAFCHGRIVTNENTPRTQVTVRTQSSGAARLLTFKGPHGEGPFKGCSSTRNLGVLKLSGGEIMAASNVRA